MLRFKNLGSGSTGNATLVQGREGARLTHLLVDCGLGIRQLEQRLGKAGLMAEQVDAIFITHEHGDHIGCARQLALRERIPVWMSHGTWSAIGEPDFDGLLHFARDTVPMEIGELQVVPFTVPHDAREPLQLSCGDGATRMGVLTDLGHATSHVLQQLAGCRSLVLECNHDPDLLESSGYPAFLKRRVGGDWGHLANGAAAAIAAHLHASGLQQVLAAHLSAQNNRPPLAQAAIAAVLGCAPQDVQVADPAQGSGWLDA